MYHNPSVFARVWTDPTKWDSPAYPHDDQVSEEIFPKLLWPTSADVQADAINFNSFPLSGPNQGGDGGSTPHNEIFQPASEEGTSPTSPGEKPERPYKCTFCSTSYAQRQGFTRHLREKHQPGFKCLEHGCDYKWNRKYEYRNHLRRRHGQEDYKIDKILETLRYLGRRAIKSDPPPHFPHPPIESDQQSLAEPQQRPLMLPVLAVGKDVHHTPPPLIPSVADNPRLGHAEPEITTTEHEDSSELEHLAVTHAPSRLLSKEDFALLRGYYKIHVQFRFPSAHPGESTTTDIPPNPGMPHSPAPPFPVGVYHTSPISGEPFSPPWADAASTRTDANWGFRNVSAGSVTGLTSRKYNLV